MAWVAPTTFVSGNALTAAQLNTLSGDLNETAPAKATATGQLFVSTGANAIAVRTPTQAAVTTAETTSSINAYGNLATVGPSVINITCGASAIVMFGCIAQNATAGGAWLMSYEYVTNSIVNAAPNGYPLRAGTENAAGSASSLTSGTRVNLQAGLTAGANTFHAKYTTPTGGTVTFQDRMLLVVPL